MKYKTTKIIFDSEEMDDLEMEIAATRIPRHNRRGPSPQGVLEMIHTTLAEMCIQCETAVTVAYLRRELRHELRQAMILSLNCRENETVPMSEIGTFCDKICNTREITYYIPIVARMFRGLGEASVVKSTRLNHGIVMEIRHPEDANYWGWD